MRIIVFGAGAVGSVLGGRVHQGGGEAVLVARRAHAEAIRTGGLALRTAAGTEWVDVPVVTSIGELTPRADDIVVITTKTQDVSGVHDELVRWNRDVPVVCGTNGVEHERVALRRFADVYGMVIQMPAEFEKPGEVTILCAPRNAILDVGRYPGGVDGRCEELAGIISSSPALSSEADPTIMVKKHAKLLVNLTNAAEAACGRPGRECKVNSAAIDEARRVYEAASIEWRLARELDAIYRARRDEMQWAIPEGDTFVSGSTWQGLTKGATAVETDFFNGEIVLLGRLHGIATPANEFLQRHTDQMLFDRIPAGSVTADTLDDLWERHRSVSV